MQHTTNQCQGCQANWPLIAIDVTGAGKHFVEMHLVKEGYKGEKVSCTRNLYSEAGPPPEPVNIWVENFEGVLALRLNWSNDRHQRVELKSLSPVDFLHALKYLSMIIEQDIFTGKL